MRRALVIGGTGFIGLHVVDALLDQGVEVRVMRRKRSVTLLLRRRPVEMVPGDLADSSAMTRAMTGVDTVFHCAGHYPRYSTQPEQSVRRALGETDAFVRALDLAGGPRAIVTGSITTLASAPDSELIDESVGLGPRPTQSPYRETKWAIEDALARARGQGLDIVSLLPGACIGPDDLKVGTSAILVGLLRGVLPFWIEGWVNVADVRDVARAHVAAALRGATAPVYALPGHNARMSALACWLVKRYGGALHAPLVSVTTARALADAAERDAEPTRARVLFPRELVDLIASGRRVSGALAARDLRFSPRPLEDTFDDAYACLRRRGLTPNREDVVDVTQ